VYFISRHSKIHSTALWLKDTPECINSLVYGAHGQWKDLKERPRVKKIKAENKKNTEAVGDLERNY
jgi:hypothetical protein